MKENRNRIALMTRGLTKSYGEVQALRGVDLEVRKGEIYGFLGPNGAGKTTTIRCLLDLIRPDSGIAKVLGIDPQIDPVMVQSRSGYLPGELQLNDNLTAERQLHYLDDTRNKAADWDFVRRLAQRLNLDLNRTIKNLSKGNKQKVGIVQALMHRPEILLLDEPTSGLDPLMQQEVMELIQEARDEGATVFFSSHIISEVEAVAERVAIIRQGVIVEVADTDYLTEHMLRKTTVRFKNAVETDALDRVPGVTVLSRNGGMSVTLQVEGEMDGLVKALGAFPVSDLETTRASLEEIFLRLTGADDE